MADVPPAVRAKLTENQQRKFSSTQIDLHGELRRRVLDLANRILDGDLAEDGVETDPHVTVRWGLHGDDPEAVQELLHAERPVRIRLGKTSIFPANEARAQRGGSQHDVVKIDVDSPDLHRLNALLGELPHTDTHPEYKPHVTLAYVRPGAGEKYAGLDVLEGEEFAADEITFSPAEGPKTKVWLNGGVQWRTDNAFASAAQRKWYFATRDNPPPNAKRMYRGGGHGASKGGFQWFSESADHAQKYADHRGGETQESMVVVERPFDAGKAKQVLSASSFFAQAATQARQNGAKPDKTRVLEERAKFNEHFGKQSLEAVDFWSNEAAKLRTRGLLEALGFDGIAVEENGNSTLATFRKTQIYNAPTENTLDPRDYLTAVLGVDETRADALLQNAFASAASRRWFFANLGKPGGPKTSRARTTEVSAYSTGEMGEAIRRALSVEPERPPVKTPAVPAGAIAVQDEQPLGGGRSITKTCSAPPPINGLGVYKPAVGEYSIHKEGLPAGTGYRREVASRVLDQELGLDLVAETTYAVGSDGPGSVQKWTEGDQLHTPQGTALWKQVPDAEVAKLAVLDLVSGNLDRHRGNVIVTPDARIAAIDNGAAFIENKWLDGPDRGWARMSIGDRLPDKLPDDVVERLQSLRARREAVTAKMEEHLTPEEVASMWDRVDAVLAIKDSFGPAVRDNTVEIKRGETVIHYLDLGALLQAQPVLSVNALRDLMRRAAREPDAVAANVIADILSFDAAGRETVVCTLGVRDGRAVRLDGDRASADYFLGEWVRGADGQPLTAEDGVRFLLALPAAYSGSRTRARLRETRPTENKFATAAQRKAFFAQRGEQRAARAASRKQPPEKPTSARAARAKASHNPCTKEKQDLSEAFEQRAAEAMGLNRSDNNRPMDNVSADDRVGVELKVLHDAKDQRVNMRRDSRLRKEAWAKGYTNQQIKANEAAGNPPDRGKPAGPPRDVFVVAYDNRDTFQGGAHADKFSGHNLYVYKGIGAVALSSMVKVKDLDEARRYIEEESR